ncbi:MAG: hypothetical protein QNJ47_01235 [Nostocaceae cyanobacterium]|nr:hypothetical protein [Nostocaceae cyanobacterium]
MYRLNKRALQILRTELENCSGDDTVSKIEAEIILKRLKELRRQQGSPATLEELRDTVVDIFPQFSDKALKQAARANQPPGIFSKIKWAAIFVTGTAGVLWVINLPYPMIRLPIAKNAPILLLPSFISMDHNYRGAIKTLEQADQLVNKATSKADIQLGENKVKQAQNHLDQLPVWFLGYYPRAYCNLFGCTWKFTVDEFETARRRTARIDAKVFQEKNAFPPLEEAQKALKIAKQEYEQAKNGADKEQAITSIQTAIDALSEISTQTIAGKIAQKKLVGYKRDFRKFSTNVADSGQTSTLIEAAKMFGMQAAQLSQNPPHSAQKWQQIAQLWQEAINRLQRIQVRDPNYLEAQQLLVQYKTNLGIIQTRYQAERESQQTLQQANRQIQRLISYPPSDSNRLQGELQGIINLLRTVKSGTTAYPQAQELLVSAQKRMNQ